MPSYAMPTLRERLSYRLFDIYDRFILRERYMRPKTRHEEEFMKVMEAIIRDDGEAYMVHNANLRWLDAEYEQ
jgi:hypothetical protein